MVGETEIQELEGLARIETKIEELLAEFSRIMALDRADDPVGYWRTLTTVLDERIDIDFQSAIPAALREELREAQEHQVALSRTS